MTAKLPWVPLYIDDYLRDTQRLTVEAHGAYLLLMLDYYGTGEPPPDDDAVLARVARCDPEQWARIRPQLERHFQIGAGRWTHNRIEAEIAAAEAKHRGKVERTATARAAALSARRDRSAMSSVTDPVTEPQESSVTDTQPQPQPQPQKKMVVVDAPARALIGPEAFDLAEAVIVLLGVDPDERIAIGAAMQVQAWLSGGWDAADIRQGIREGMAGRKGTGPPKTLRYFEPVIARLHADRGRALPVATPSTTATGANHGRHQPPAESLTAVALRHAEQGITLGPRPRGLRLEAGGVPAGPVPDGERG
jgi:uncharacterized protein YdaU (DUF1376 family)